MLLGLFLLALASAQVRAEAAPANGKTLGVGVDTFIDTFNGSMIRFGFAPRIERSYVQDDGGVNIVVRGPLGQYANLVAGVSRKNRELANMVVMVKEDAEKGGVMGVAAAISAISAVIPGSTPESMTTTVIDLLKQGGGKARFGDANVMVHNLGVMVTFSVEPS